MFKIPGTAAAAAALLLTIQATAQTSSGTPSAPLAGCVQKDAGIYTLVDENSKTKVQLRGGNLRAGQHIQVTGTADANASPAGGATQVLEVSGVQRTAGSCPGASSGFHLSKAHVISIAIVGGLVVFGIVKAAGRIGPSI
ncbi:MAG TPA: hypothetical protein VNY05_25135 [Candidatus Acidoferrales bacterium]|jgi:hypothetical protein|nr:hypothetical protein [Candidatus Acidoferrales bacterium]